MFSNIAILYINALKIINAMVRPFFFLLLITASLFTSVEVDAQTTVLTPNPYFEDGVAPNSLGGIHFCLGYHAMYGSPDYFVNPQFGSGTGMPENFFGYQDDINGGSAYGGFMGFSINLPLECMYSVLSDSVRPIHTYLIEFQYSLANTSALSCDKIGYRLGGVERFFPPYPTDTVGWITYNDTLTPLVADITLEFGQLRPSPSLVSAIQVFPLGDMWAYYYVGEAKVTQTDTMVAVAPFVCTDPNSGCKLVGLLDFSGNRLALDYDTGGRYVIEEWADRRGGIHYVKRWHD